MINQRCFCFCFFIFIRLVFKSTKQRQREQQRWRAWQMQPTSRLAVIVWWCDKSRRGEWNQQERNIMKTKRNIMKNLNRISCDGAWHASIAAFGTLCWCLWSHHDLRRTNVIWLLLLLRDWKQSVNISRYHSFWIHLLTWVPEGQLACEVGWFVHRTPLHGETHFAQQSPGEPGPLTYTTIFVWNEWSINQSNYISRESLFHQTYLTGWASFWNNAQAFPQKRNENN